MVDVEVSNNEADKRYEARVDGELAGAAYYLSLIHISEPTRPY